MNDIEFNVVAQRLKVVAHPQRLKILEILKGGELSVSDIQSKLHMKQSITSQHLNVLKNNRILSSRREGNTVYYFLLIKDFGKIINFVESLAF